VSHAGAGCLQDGSGSLRSNLEREISSGGVAELSLAASKSSQWSNDG